MSEHPLILFDGVCNLCNSSVQFIIRRDPQARFRFAALQSETGEKVLRDHSIPPGLLNTIILLLDGKAYQKSNAALEIARRLTGLWPTFYLFKIVPRFIRDWVYDGIAVNRYRFFGRQKECMIPTPELKARFVS